MEQNNLSQKDLGDIVGVSRQTITNIENGKSEMKWSLFLALMFIFSMSHNSTEYLKRIDIPYSEIKNWLRKKSRAEKWQTNATYVVFQNKDEIKK